MSSSHPRALLSSGASGLGACALLAALFVSNVHCGPDERGSDDGGVGGEAGGGSVAGEERSSRLDEIVIARVGRTKITGADLAEKIRVQFKDMEGLSGPTGLRQREEVLRAMVDQYCWVTLGEKKGYDKDPEFRGTLELSRKFILTNHTANREVYSKAKATPEEVRQHYEDNLDQYQVVARAHASMILTKTREDAARLRGRLAAGADFGDLAAVHSIDEVGRARRGEIGTVTHASTISGFPAGGPLNQAIMALPKGGLSDPIETERGWALVLVHDKMETTTQPFEEVREAIQAKLDKKKAHDLFAQVLNTTREELGAGIDERGWEAYASSFLSEEELYQLAMTEPKVDKRLSYLRILVDHHPDGRRAPSALFLVGFTLAEERKDYAQAGETFRNLLQRYPGDQLAESARWMLENMEQGIDKLPYANELKRRAQSGAP